MAVQISPGDILNMACRDKFETALLGCCLGWCRMGMVDLDLLGHLISVFVHLVEKMRTN